MSVSLTDEQVAAFRRDGFLALDELVPPGEVGRLREVYDRLVAERAGRDRGDHFDLAGAPPREHPGEPRYPWNETRRTARAERAAAAAKGTR